MNRLEKIEARLNAATPGEWRWVHTVHDEYGANLWLASSSGESVIDTVCDPHITEADAELIVHAPEDIRYLLNIARAAKEFLATDQEYGLVVEPEVQAAMDRLWAALDE